MCETLQYKPKQQHRVLSDTKARIVSIKLVNYCIPCEPKKWFVGRPVNRGIVSAMNTP